MPLAFEVGDIVKLKKSHNCGSHEWELLRVGMDFRMRCLGCNHEAWTPRTKLEKNFRGFVKRPSEENQDNLGK